MKDMIGNELQIGDWVCYNDTPCCYFGYEGKPNAMCCGKIIEFTAKQVRIENINPVTQRYAVNRFKAKAPHNVVKVVTPVNN